MNRFTLFKIKLYSSYVLMLVGAVVVAWNAWEILVGVVIALLGGWMFRKTTGR